MKKILRKIAVNRFTCFVGSFFREINNFGVLNTVKSRKRRKTPSFREIENDFSKYKSSEIMLELIKKKFSAGTVNHTPYNIGYCIFGALFADFIMWIYENSGQYDELWFLAREGWLLEKLYRKYCLKKNTDCNGVYFLSSRRAASIASIRNKDEIREILSLSYLGSFKNLCRERFGYEYEGQDFCIKLPDQIETAVNRLDIQCILSIAQKERNAYLAYINGRKKNAAVVDVGYSGTIQYYISKLTQRQTDGLYLSSHFNSRSEGIGCKVKSLYPVCNLLEERTNFVYSRQLYLEAVLKAPFGQLIFFDGNRPVYNDDCFVNQNICEIQKGILDFADDYYKAYSGKREKNTFVYELYEYGLGTIKGDAERYFSVNDDYCSDGTHVLSDGKWVLKRF